MNLKEQIDTLTSNLNAIEAAIAEVQAALNASADPDEIQSLGSKLTDLQAQHERLADQLNNLQMAAVGIGTIAPDAADQVRTLSADLDKIILRRTSFASTLDFANAVLAKVAALRTAAA